jgi:hypothetical protein
MSRYIDADKLKENMMQIANNSSMKKYIIDTYIDNAPTAEVKPIVYGEWIMCGNDDLRGYSSVFECSNCGDITRIAYEARDCLFDFCPNCGADMRKESEGKE